MNCEESTSLQSVAMWLKIFGDDFWRNILQNRIFSSSWRRYLNQFLCFHVNTGDALRKCGHFWRQIWKSLETNLPQNGNLVDMFGTLCRLARRSVTLNITFMMIRFQSAKTKSCQCYFCTVHHKSTQATFNFNFMRVNSRDCSGEQNWEGKSEMMMMSKWSVTATLP